MTEPVRPVADKAVLDGLLEAVPGGVVHISSDGAVLRANPAAILFLGIGYDVLTRRYTRDFAGDTWFEDGTPCGPEQYPVTIALQTGLPAGPTTIGVRQPGGDVRWAVFRALPVVGGGAVVAFLDITERREAEERLRESERMAALGRIAEGVAHEVNNPLAFATLALERALHADDPVPHVHVALEGLRRIEGLIRDLQARNLPASMSQEGAPPAIVGAPVPAARSARVLVIDDEPRIGEMVGWVLRAHEVTSVLSARAALELLEHEHFDVVICDLMMPELTGMDLHAELSRTRPELLERFVFVTGGAYLESARRFVERDDVRCLDKPFRIAELRDLVESIARG